ncbi:GAF domain-containing sensor histidine kinase [Dissulfurirhabdus thermomarina]|uniref:GAF domain-containing sensor histidine kinase n=1 Tax=Dissulfurirhabdus thermomarina TaxID=1765737 RepID=A0A6N9TU75_DISTH|nr:GAF domain-containing sensor histidine kinase [Dissulfurirhabdus thermomarina]NDY42987.1 GAF domain-containing sensor histidine kinase [Dissulfurirhabdus thermomarina]NMX22721.1 GAF domain-containing sensor histidine kinase [Dissulfurirhabdus thermomarina]
MKTSLRRFLASHPGIRDLALPGDVLERLAQLLEEDFLADFLGGLIRETEAVMAVDPRLPLKDILRIAAERIVRGLGAKAASIRLFDPETLQMTSFGGFGIPDTDREREVPVADSVAGLVVRENRSIPVPSILDSPHYRDKDVVRRRGVRSLLAVPLRIPSFFEGEGDVLGSLQIYYEADHRRFSPLEVLQAELMARRVSYVLAKKKILDLRELNDRKERIVDEIFVKISNREGIKLKDLFILLIPVLERFLQVRSCALFTVSDDGVYIHLEAAYPPDLAYHETGYTFTVAHHPYFERAVQEAPRPVDTPTEKITPAYVLVRDPLASPLTSPGLRAFARAHQIHSILLVPLRVKGRVRHLITLYAGDQKEAFTEEEIELVTFFGKEIMKATRLEFLGDLLHDFKNPAVAVAGFAGRARRLLDAEPDLEAVRERLKGYLDIVVRETVRLQDLAIGMTAEGREEALDLGRVALDRYRINEEVVRESRRTRLRMEPPEVEPGLLVFCPRFGLERVLDNLLNNATKAVPEEGGRIAMRVFRDGRRACLELRNTGEIPAEHIDQVRRGQVRGRGLNIITRFVQANHGRMEVWTETGETVFRVCLPLVEGGAGAG